MQKKKSLWAFGTREVVFAAIGAALYGVLSYATNMLQIPGTANVSIRPAVVIPIFFGVAFGPWVGLISGGLGNLIGDLISGYGFYWNWDLANAIMGFIPGLVYTQMTTFKAAKDIITAEIATIVGIIVAFAFAGVSDIFIYGYDFHTALVGSFIPPVATDIINGGILLPIFMVAYSAVVARSGR
jgi:energy-coupling factor transport system substrate-specific component